MAGSFARLLQPFTLGAALLACAFLGGTTESARAQAPTPSKTLCAGDPPGNATATTCNLNGSTTNPNPYVPVYFAVTATASSSGPLTINESLPPGFTWVNVLCTAPAANGVGPISTVSHSPLGASPLIVGPLSVAAGNSVRCFVTGYFSNPGGAVVNSVTESQGTATSTAFQLGVNVASPTTFPSDLSVVKSVTWQGMPAALDVSLFPQTAHYKIVVTNNGPQPVYLGQAFKLRDFVHASSTGVPLQAHIVGTPVCAAAPSTTSCLGVVAGGLFQTALTNPPLNLANWQFPASGPNAAGFLPVGGTITMTFDVEVQRHPDLLCAKGQEALLNDTRIEFNNFAGLNFPDPNPTNNVASSAAVPVHTGMVIDPDCALPVNGPISVTKQQMSPTSSPVAWASNVSYLVTIANSDPNPIIVRLRDRVMPWWGTPNFVGTVVAPAAVSGQCSPGSACPTTPTITSPQSFATYALQQTVYDQQNVTVPGAVNNQPGVVTFPIKMKYAIDNYCDSFANGDNQIINIGRADYTYNGQNYVSEGAVGTIMAPVTPNCQFQVLKEVLDTDKLVYGSAIDYNVSFRNAGTQAVHVGTVFDAMRLQQSNYANQINYTGNYSCAVVGGAITGGVPTSSTSLSGSVYYTPTPSQGTRIFQNSGVMNFGPNSELKCHVELTFSRPQADDPHCLSSGDPRLENLALMDQSQFYSPYTPFPPSSTYNPTINPVTTPQPPSATAANWRMVDVHLPKCYKLNINKFAQPNFSWAPGGPSPILYTIQVTNAGDTLNWNDFRIADAFTSGYGSPPTLMNIGVTACPGETGSLGNSATALSYAITHFPAPCVINATFTVATPNQPGQVCNHASVGVEPNPGPGTDTDDWYANDPNPALLNRDLCTPILQTSQIAIKKEVDNQAGAVLPANFLYPVKTVCTTPNPNGAGFAPPSVTTSYTSSVADGGVATIDHVPVTSTCVVTEQTNLLPALSHSNCPAPSAPQWVTPPTYYPGQSVAITAPGPVVVGIMNQIKCVMPPVKTLTVTKAFQPSSLQSTLPAGTTFPISVACTPTPNDNFNLTPANPTHTTNNILVGAACHVTEGTPSGYTLPPHCKWAETATNGGAITIEPQGNPTVTVTNALNCDPDLAVVKTGPVQDPNDPYNYIFTITVTSVGGPFTAAPNSIHLTDAVYSSGLPGVLSGLTTSSPNWTCSLAQCAYTGAGPQIVGEVLGTFTISYRPVRMTPYVNCATVALAPADWNPANDNSCIAGGRAVPQIDLKVTKTGPQPSGQPGVSQFSITLLNNGASFTLPAGADLVLQDVGGAMPGGVMNISRPAATALGSWSCPFSGANATCTYTATSTQTIASGFAWNFVVFYHPKPLENFTNCAIGSVADGVNLLDVFPPNNKSCVSVSPYREIKGPPFIGVVPEVVTPPIPSPLACDPKTTRVERGACACKFEGMQRNSDTVCACPTGSTLDASERCVKPQVCKPPMVANPAGGACICPPGTQQRGAECVKPLVCKPPMIANPSGADCVCPPGAQQRGSECVKPLVCKPPMIASPSAADCVCPPGTVQRGNECVKAPH